MAAAIMVAGIIEEKGRFDKTPPGRDYGRWYGSFFGGIIPVFHRSTDAFIQLTEMQMGDIQFVALDSYEFIAMDGIPEIRFLPFGLFHVFRMCQDRLEGALLQDIEDRDPIFVCGFHADALYALGFEPLRHRGLLSEMEGLKKRNAIVTAIPAGTL